MRSFLVTGGNKGIGLAVVSRILKDIDQSFVFLCSRSLARGQAALKSLESDLQKRIKLVKLDVAAKASLADAVQDIQSFLKNNPDMAPIEGLVNNAGVLGNLPMKEVLDINVRAVYNVTNAIIPLMKPNGRVVNMGSGSAPNLVAECNEEGIKFFTDTTMTLKRMESMMKSVTEDFDSNQGSCKALASIGLTKDCGDDLTAYAFSKALLHSLTMIQARENPGLSINACSPGFIISDMTLDTFAGGKESRAQEMGMKTPEEGTESTYFLLTRENPEGNGYYFGSDCKRSPLHKYRSPGSPEYQGGDL